MGARTRARQEVVGGALANSPAAASQPGTQAALRPAGLARVRGSRVDRGRVSAWQRGSRDHDQRTADGPLSFPHATPAQLDYALVEKRAYLLRDVQVWSNQSVAMTRGREHDPRDGFLRRALAGRAARAQVRALSGQTDTRLVHDARARQMARLLHLSSICCRACMRCGIREVRALGRVRILLAQRLRDAELALLVRCRPSTSSSRCCAGRCACRPTLPVAALPLGRQRGVLADDYVSWFLEQAHPAHGTRGAGEAREAILISRRSARARRLSNESESRHAWRRSASRRTCSRP